MGASAPAHPLNVRPRLGLRSQLLLVALPLALLLPWAGWQLLREIESLLRQGEEQALLASADVLASALASTRGGIGLHSTDLFVQTLPRPPQLDGDITDWAAVPRRHFGAEGSAPRFSLALGHADDTLYLLVETALVDARPADAHWPIAARSDHLRLSIDGPLGALALRLANADAGPLRVTADDGAPPAVRLHGHWRPNSDGFVAEWQLPQGLWPERVGLQLHDADASGRMRTIGTDVGGVPTLLPLSRRSPGLMRPIAPLLPQAMRARLLQADGWILAEAGALPAVAGDALPWWRRQLYQRLLHADAALAADDASAQRSDGPEIWRALSGVPAAAWRHDPEHSRLLLSAAVPLRVGAEVRGVLQLEREQQTLLLTERALGGLMLSTLFALSLAGLVLLAFASRLGWRIRRLRDDTAHALQRDGRLRAVPASTDADEIGDLSRGISRLLSEVGESQAYLRSLAGKLSHELNTPIAIVRGALDNIDAGTLPTADRACIERARAGSDRLAAIVRAMSEAGRIEQAIHGAEAEDADLVELLERCASGYRTLLSPRALQLQLPQATLRLHCAPELLVQALDKLIDNARGFTTDNGWVRMTLECIEDGARLRVANQGPALPATASHRLFESLVSLRPERGSGVHLGFGLYIVRLVTELHRGTVAARNLPDGDGVEFELTLRALPRQR
jgi:two-component system, OmpR family, sensor histidine kinase ChvG